MECGSCFYWEKKICILPIYGNKFSSILHWIYLMWKLFVICICTSALCAVIHSFHIASWSKVSKTLFRLSKIVIEFSKATFYLKSYVNVLKIVCKITKSDITKHDNKTQQVSFTNYTLQLIVGKNGLGIAKPVAALAYCEDNSMFILHRFVGIQMYHPTIRRKQCNDTPKCFGSGILSLLHLYIHLSLSALCRFYIAPL